MSANVSASAKEMNPTRDDFAALLDEAFPTDNLMEGMVVKGTIVAIEKDLALIDVGLAARSAQPERLWRERVRLLEELKTASQMESGPLLLQARMD